MGQQSPAPNPAEAYERFIAQNVFVPWTADLLQRARPRAEDRVLDVACGTGIVTRNVASAVGPRGKVAALDISPDMLAVARTLALSEGPAVEWHEGSGIDMPFPEASFDLVLCQQGLQFFPDHQAGLNEIRRVLAPGGRAVVSVWRDLDGQPFMKAIEVVVARHVVSGAFAVAFSLADSEHLGQLAAAAGFESAEVHEVGLTLRVKDKNEFGPMMLQGAAAALPEFQAIPQDERQAKIASMRAELTDALQPFVDGEALVLDTAANVLVAQR